MPKTVKMMLIKSTLMQFLTESHKHHLVVICQGPLCLGVFPRALPVHIHLIKIVYHIMILELDTILFSLLLYSGYILSHSHVTQEL